MGYKDLIDSMVDAGRKGGPIDDGHGSQRIWHNGKYILYYRKVFADALGIDPDDIPDEFSVHHIDGDRENNDDIDNLILCTRKAHEKLELMMDPHHYDPVRNGKKKGSSKD